MLCSVAYNNLRRFVVYSIVSQKFLSNRLAQFRDAGTRSVLGKARFKRCDCGGLDVFGSIKVRLACSEAANVDPFGFHRFGLTIDRKVRDGVRLVALEESCIKCFFQDYMALPVFSTKDFQRVIFAGSL